MADELPGLKSFRTMAKVAQAAVKFKRRESFHNVSFKNTIHR